MSSRTVMLRSPTACPAHTGDGTSTVATAGRRHPFRGCSRPSEAAQKISMRSQQTHAQAARREPAAYACAPIVRGRTLQALDGLHSVERARVLDEREATGTPLPPAGDSDLKGVTNIRAAEIASSRCKRQHDVLTCIRCRGVYYFCLQARRNAVEELRKLRLLRTPRQVANKQTRNPVLRSLHFILQPKSTLSKRKDRTKKTENISQMPMWAMQVGSERRYLNEP